MTMTTTQPSYRARPRGFTLVELLTVMAIIALLSLMALPALRMMDRMTRGGAGVNSVTVAVAAAQAYATRSKSFGGIVPNARYSGVAILFTPSNEMRLVENVEAMSQTDGTPLEPNRNGFADIADRDYIIVPDSYYAWGISRGGAVGSAYLNLLAPPFAIRFDENGSLLAGASSNELLVFYDTNSNGVSLSGDGYGRSDPFGATLSYSPDDWDTRNENASVAVDPNGIAQLPFESIETVIGVLLVPAREMREAMTDAGYAELPGLIQLSDSASDAVLQGTGSGKFGLWLLNNGITLFFNRYTGAVIRERNLR